MALRGLSLAFVGMGDQQYKILSGKVKDGGGTSYRVNSSNPALVPWDELTHVVVASSGSIERSVLFKKLGRELDRVPPVVHFNFINAGGSNLAAHKLLLLPPDEDEDDNESVVVGSAAAATATAAAAAAAAQVTQSLSLSIVPPPISASDQQQQLQQLQRNSPSMKLAPRPLMVMSEGEKRENKNTHITRVFQELVDLLPPGMDTGNTFRRRSYLECIRALSRLPFKVTHLSDVRDRGYSGFGTSNCAKLHDILHSDDGLCEKLRALRENPSFKCIAEIRKTWGIGTRRATALYHDFGCRSIDDLRRIDQDHPSFFTHMVKLGIKYYDEIDLPVPKDEARRIFALVEAAAKAIEPRAEALICGSARREDDSTSSDVDVLLVVPTSVVLPPDAEANDQDWDDEEERNLLKRLLADLAASGVLTDHGAGMRGHGASYMGICVDTTLPEAARTHRRIDIKVYPQALGAFGLLHFTGNTLFNRALSAYSNTFFTESSPHGLKNTKLGLFRRTGTFDRKGDSIQLGRIPCATEEDIFAALHLQYRPPTERFSVDDLLPLSWSKPAAAALQHVKAMRPEELVRVTPDAIRVRGANEAEGEDGGAAEADEGEDNGAAAGAGAVAGIRGGMGDGEDEDEDAEEAPVLDEVSKKRARESAAADAVRGLEPPLCHCNRPCKIVTVTKSGPSNGHLFWSCVARNMAGPKGGGGEVYCTFFAWGPNPPAGSAGMHMYSPQPYSGAAPASSSGSSGAKLPSRSPAAPPRKAQALFGSGHSPARGDTGVATAAAASAAASSSTSKLAKDECARCGGRGHWANQCTGKRRR